MRRLLVLWLWPVAVSAQPEMRGPHAVEVWEAGAVQAAGALIPTRVYFAPDAPPGPVVGVIHGFLRLGHYHQETARTLASRGFVAVVPDMPCGAVGCDHDANAEQLSALLDWAVAASDSDTPVRGRADGERRGLIGHSWGGLSSFLCTARDPRIDAVVGFDPHDDRNAAVGQAPNVRVPSAHLMAENRGACNGDWGVSVYPGTASPHLRLMVRGSGHCDPEDPSDFLCPIACGAGNAATTPTFRRYAVAWMACVLQGDASVAPWIGGEGLAADTAAGTLGAVDHAQLERLPCRAAPVDAGPPPDPAPDAAVSPDASPDAASPADGAPSNPRDAGSTPARDAVPVPTADSALADAVPPSRDASDRQRTDSSGESPLGDPPDARAGGPDGRDALAGGPGGAGTDSAVREGPGEDSVGADSGGCASVGATSATHGLAAAAQVSAAWLLMLRVRRRRQRA